MLRDHFHPPLSKYLQWHSTHHAWAVAIAAQLNERLPTGLVAAPNVRYGIEIDIATLDRSEGLEIANAQCATTLEYAVPQPTLTLEFPLETDVVEIEIFANTEELRLVGAIELVSPANKDREEHRTAFLSKCEHLLRRGIGVAIIDIVTERKSNLHVSLLRRFGVERVPEPGELYAASYRPVTRDEQQQLDVWEASLTIGSDLPTIPLALLGGITVPLELAASYERACRELRIT